MRDAVARSLVTHHHALPQKDFLKADVFVVKSLTSPGQRVEWMAKLGGLAIVSSDYAMGAEWAHGSNSKALPRSRPFATSFWTSAFKKSIRP